jgi:hypothetical protein
MKGNQNHNRYDTPKILFIEYNPLFNRLDIINRIDYLASKLLSIKSIGIIYFDQASKNYLLHLVLRRKNGEIINLHGNLYELIKKFYSGCNKIILLDPNGSNNLSLIRKNTCFLAGLHSDIPHSVLSFVRRNYPLKRASLSRIDYLASQVLIIVDHIKALNNTFYLLYKL